MRYIAFLRGVNVGGRIIKMADLKVCIEAQGFKEVKTYLQSGNVVLESNLDIQSVRQKLEGSVGAQFNYPAKILVYGLDDIGPIINDYPFDIADKTSQHYVVFMDQGLEKVLVKEAMDPDSKVEEIELGDGVIYWRVPKGMSLKSGFSKYLTKAKYKEFNTVRNISTLQKLIA